LRDIGVVRGPLVVAFRGADTTKYLAAHGARAFRAVFRHGSLFLPVSEEFARRLRALGCPADRLLVHRTGIDVSALQWRTRELAPGDPLRVIAVARLVEKKGLGDLVEAVRLLRDRGIPVALDIVGRGPLEAALQLAITQAGLDGAARLRGWQPQQAALAMIDRAHVLAQPSIVAANADEEGIPNVLKEAMALGLPVVATRHAGIPELVEDGVSGWLVPERNAEALAGALERLYRHPETWRRMGAAGRAVVERDYDIRRLNDRLEQLLADVAAGRPPQPARTSA
jgi:colanic acid/amylovoran biosynthesis glycosyltransferase